MKLIEFFGGPHDGGRREIEDEKIAITLPWYGVLYLYTERPNWGQVPVIFDFKRPLV